MIGNDCEWTSEPFVIGLASRAAKLRNAQARAANQKIMKGGSHIS